MPQYRNDNLVLCLCVHVLNSHCKERQTYKTSQAEELQTTVEETRKTSSLALQNSRDIIPLSGYNNYILIS